PPPRSTLFPYTTLFRFWGPLTIPNGNISFNAYDAGRLFNVTSGGDIRNLDPVNGTLGWNGNYFHLYTTGLASEYQVQAPVTASKDRKSTRLNSSHLVSSY